jgi:hypothetical protein
VGIICNMSMRNRKLRHWLGHILMTAMLFTQSALLWAQVAAPMQSPHRMQHICDSQQAPHTDSAPQHCRQDCCQQNHTCPNICLSACVTPGVILPATAMVTVFPYFHIPSTHPTLALPPDGMHSAVLERPPRSFA